MNDKEFLRIAVDQAIESVKQGGFPAGSIVVKDGEIISKGLSLGGLLNDPTSHAETSAIRQACTILKTTNLNGATLYESLESCNMCFSVANWAGISRIVTGAKKTPEMVRKEFYEGEISTTELNEKNNHKIELLYIPDFESEMQDLISAWENKMSK